jgi:GAF domain-containing protein
MSHPQRTTHPEVGFAELGRIVLGEQSLEDVLAVVAQVAKRVLPTSAEASMTLIDGDKPVTVAFTGPMAIELDERQYDRDRGPCLRAAREGETFMIADTATDERWPDLTADARALGIRSTLSVPLPLRREIQGGLNLYAYEADAFDERAMELAETFAGYAAVAVDNSHLFAATEELATQMREAMASRAVIEQAKGILMGQRNCDADEAFAILVTLSQESHRKLREVAQALIEHTVAP